MLLHVSQTSHFFQPIRSVHIFQLVIRITGSITSRCLTGFYISLINSQSILNQIFFVCLFVIHIHKLCSIQHIIIGTNILYRTGSRIRDSRLTSFTSLGSNQNHTMPCTCSINSGRSSIFQDRNRFYIIRI